MNPPVNLTPLQKNHAVYLPAISSFYSTYVAKQRLEEFIPKLLEQIQQGIYLKALKHREENTHYIDTWAEFEEFMNTKNGFVYAHWDGTPETEDKIKDLTKATIRCIPLDNKMESGIYQIGR